MDAGERAGAELARRKVKRASGLLREAAGALTHTLEGGDILGVQNVSDPSKTHEVVGLIALGVSRYGAVDVVVIAHSPGSTPPTAPREGAKENTHGTSTQRPAGRSEARHR